MSEDIEKAIMNPKKKKDNNIYFPTGSDLLDTLVGGGEGLGYRAGKIVNFVGDKSSGKTFEALEVIAASYYKFGKKLKWVYDDCESGFSFDTEKLYGFEIMPVDKSKRIKSQTVEQLYCNVRNFFENEIKSDEFGIYVIDSLDGCTSEESNKLADERFKAFNKNTKFDKGSYKMGKAKYLSDEFFPQLTDMIETKNGLLIVISQVRCNIDPMSFEKFTRSGGKAMDFYCHTVLWLANIRKLKKKDRPIGVVVKVRNTKSKTPRPYREGYITILFDYGIDNISTNVDFLFDFLTPTGMIEKDAQASWSSPDNVTMAQLKDFLSEINKENYYRKNVSKSLHKEEVLAWINNSDNTSIKKKFDNKFSTKMKRNDLIDYVINNSLEDELKQRTINKWEAIEESIKSNRKPKYR